MTELIVALDQTNMNAAYAMNDAYEVLDKLPDQIWYKIGMQLFLSGGMDVPDDLMKYDDKRIFLDLKLYDVMDTIEKTVFDVLTHDVEMLTVCGLDVEILIGARNAIKTYKAKFDKEPVTKIIAVGKTTGSSQTKGDIYNLANVVDNTSLHGIVCSAQHARTVKQDFPNMLVISPGIRYEDAEQDCHAPSSVATPMFARQAGVDFIVVGRPITRAKDPLAEQTRILYDIA